MNLPGPSERIVQGIRGFFKAKNPRTLVASGLASALVLLFLLASMFDQGESSEPSTVLKIGEGFATHPPLSVGTQGMSLIATNGAVISDPALIEVTSDGPLPKISQDGRAPMAVYARHFDATDPRPRVALILGGLGLGSGVTQSAVDELPPGITFAFTPYGSSLQGVVSTARANGHEVMLEVPLEPYDYPDNDPGQNTLLTGTASNDNGARFKWVLSRVTGYAGLINSQGSKFLASGPQMQALMKDVKHRGLYFVDSGQSDQSLGNEAATNASVAFVRGDHVIDKMPARDAIEKELAQLEALALQRGRAVGIAAAYPITVERLKAWALGLEQKGIALVPVSALVVIKKPVEVPKVSTPPARAHHKETVADGHESEPVKPGPHP